MTDVESILEFRVSIKSITHSTLIPCLNIVAIKRILLFVNVQVKGRHGLCTFIIKMKYHSFITQMRNVMFKQKDL